MSELFNKLSNIELGENLEKQKIVNDVSELMVTNGYTVEDVDSTRPWGAFLRFKNEEADNFVEDFFPDINPVEARLGGPDAELSPKILIVSPKQRLSWQYHERRAERWAFITDGKYDKSMTDEEQGVVDSQSSESVQFSPLERHRLIGRVATYTLVAEIWQHTDSDNLSSEDDIIRLSDDYSRY